MVMEGGEGSKGCREGMDVCEDGGRNGKGNGWINGREGKCGFLNRGPKRQN